MKRIKNFEFKAKVENAEDFEKKLQSLNPVFIGEDHQVDTYFIVEKGRLKLREGNIENALIHYQRENIVGAKQSDILLYQHHPEEILKQILTLHLGIKTVVDKKRKIYFIDNVKFHFDIVKDLGHFIEVEAINNDESYTISELKEQCEKYFQFFGLAETQLVGRSYSDLILEKQQKNIKTDYEAIE